MMSISMESFIYRSGERSLSLLLVLDFTIKFNTSFLVNPRLGLLLNVLDILTSNKLSAMLISDREDPRGRLPSVNLDCQYQP
jgi:uncharacterized membrane protein